MAMISGATGLAQVIPSSIQKALAINPAPGSTYLDAEHIVLLMQENRSFDHAFGTLRGVRGFNDPRAIRLPNNHPVWLQTNAAGETYAPFRLNIKDTKITWMGSLPHGRESQVDARRLGFHDGWLEAKKSGEPAYAHMPLTMGYYTREDIPMYYAMADAFTVCDQNFCSALSPTDPNRLYFWSGTVRSPQDVQVKAYLDNGEIENGVQWETFPELLESNGIHWKVYQNELGIDGGFVGDEDSWLGNYGDNPLEYFRQYNVQLTHRYINYLPKKAELIQGQITHLQEQIKNLPSGDASIDKLNRHLEQHKTELAQTQKAMADYTRDKYDALPDFSKAIHEKAFAVNTGDPHQHELTPLVYQDGDTQRTIHIPKGDLFHQFREDVKNGTLPTVSWLVAPEYFSDHPSAPWFGSWYLSESLDILTANPEVWKKTIFILAYDENDGYFDHQPPFVAPDPSKPQTGKVSAGIDASLEQVIIPEDFPGSIGLGYRVPLVIASPWSRGGWVNSQVFDHTSTLQFLEHFLAHKTGKPLTSPNITQWRRTVCGDLSTVFRPDKGNHNDQVPFMQKDAFIEQIHKAKFKDVPKDYHALSTEEIALMSKDVYSSAHMPVQEKGIRPACAIPYDLSATASVSSGAVWVEMKASKETFGDASLGSPFLVFSNEKIGQRAYAVSAGDTLKDSWNLSDFEGNAYALSLHGPNGFFREFKGDASDPAVTLNVVPAGDKLTLHLSNSGTGSASVVLTDHVYGNGSFTKTLAPGGTDSVTLDLKKSHHWYDFSMTLNGNQAFGRRYAGHIETGRSSFSDPYMGRVV
jgi:phospholipase C